MNPFNKDEQLFSICTPCYGETYVHLEQMAKTLNNQEYKKFEWIIVFDGKHPRGEKLLKKIIKDYPELTIKYETIEHGGAPKARNHAFSLSKGEYIVFLDADIFLYPEALRVWSNEFDSNPKLNRVWGIYDLIDNEGNVLSTIGQPPVLNDDVWYPALKFSNFISGNFPLRRRACPKWDESLKSLQDWDFTIQMLKPDFKGKDHKFLNHHFFATPMPHEEGISMDSHKNWQARVKEIREKHNLPISDIVVTSLGAMNHAYPTCEMLNADFLPMPSFKPHTYDIVYLLGFYLREDPNYPGMVTRSHMKVFEGNKGKNIVHWIGTDIWDLHRHCSFDKIKELKEWFKENKVIHLCEADFTQKELEEVGIKAKIVPLPPKKVYSPVELPKKFSVGVYLPGRDLYNESLVMEVVRAMPDVQFYFFGDHTRKAKGENWEYLGYIDYDEWIPKMSCNLRITIHDGLPLTSVQFLTAGRNVITNVPVKGAIHVQPTLKDIVAGIRKAQREPLSKKVSEFWIKELSVEKFIKTIRGLK